MRNQGSYFTASLAQVLAGDCQNMGSPATERQGRKAKLSKENCLHEAQH